MREVDEAVREDQIFSFWRRYGILVAVLVVVGLAGFGGYLFWQNQQVSKAEAQSERFATMLKAAQSARLDQADYDALVEAGGGYKTQAELVKAALAAGANDVDPAIASYDVVIADPDAPAPFKDLALVRRTALAFDKMEPQAVIDALAPLAVPGNAFFGSAGEMTAIAYLQMDKKAEAGEMFASMSRDPAVIDSVRQRAAQVASTLGVAPESIGNLADQVEERANAK